MKRFCLLASGVVAMVSASVVVAQPQTSTVRDNGFSYDYLQAGYENRDWDGGWETDGIDFKLSHALDEHLFVRGGLQFFDGDVDIPSWAAPWIDDDVDGWELSAGLGFHTPLKPGLDLVLTGDIVHVDADIDDETGFALSGGVRHETTAELELNGGVFVQDVGESEIGLFGGALFHATQKVDLGAELRLGGDLTQFGVFGRYNF